MIDILEAQFRLLDMQQEFSTRATNVPTDITTEVPQLIAEGLCPGRIGKLRDAQVLLVDEPALLPLAGPVNGVVARAAATANTSTSTATKTTPK